jgi:RecA-family ATPase
MTDRERALAILEELNPGALTYEDWLHVGMILKAVGATCADWSAWSARDAERYHPRQMPGKWDGFRGSGLGMGSLVELARRHGIEPPRDADDAGAFGWDDRVVIGQGGSGKRQAESGKREEEIASERPLVDERWVEADEIPLPAADWAPGDMIRYLESMFEPDEYVGLVATAWLQEDSGRWLPQKGVCDRTRAELCEILRRDGVVEAMGDPHPIAGAWVRINPMDGSGCKDANVTAYRHSLIEADHQDLGKQLALIRALQLPCSAVVHSGGKSIHALVRVDARDADEYRQRVNRLYEVCKASGLTVDNANRNPSRLSRLPGVERSGRPQYLIDTRCGQESWEAWEAHIQEAHDDLPDPEPLQGVYFDLPALAPALIAGILREGHKMRLTGPSKAGKSFSLIELAVAIAEGREWMGMPCRQGPVLYINLELDRASCLHRFRQVYEALGWKPETISAIEVWNLRGHAVPLDKLAPKLIRRAVGKGYVAVIIDPIYKLQWGDENDAGDVARFCNQLDRICYELGAAVIDAHHHSKGVQGQKRSIDRGSGSGVFGRDPDAILDMIELDVGVDRRGQVETSLVADALTALAGRLGLDLNKVPIDARAPADAFLLAFQAAFKGHGADAANEVYLARRLTAMLSGWRVEATLREFAPAEPRRVWFRHPVHIPDEWGLLLDAKAAGEAPPWEAERQAKEESRKAAADSRREELETAIKAAGGVGEATVKAVAEGLGVDVDTVRNRLKGHREYTYRNGLIMARKDDHEEQ